MPYSEILQIVAKRKIELTYEIAKYLKNRVCRGPFKGLKIEIGDLFISNKLLGIYEECLHPWIDLVLSYMPDCIVNVGCGDGYYAVGMGIRCPSAHVVCIDTNKKCIEELNINAIANDFTNYTTYTMSTPEIIETSIQSCERPLVFMDCEGAEKDLLDPTLAPSLTKALILVELHPFEVPGIESLIESRFSKTHVIHRILQTTPSVHIPELHSVGDWDKVIIMSESRPCTMEWFCCIPN